LSILFVRVENGSTAGKTLLRLNEIGTRRGGPHPHGLSPACAAFFMILTARSKRFSTRTNVVDRLVRENAGVKAAF
jgi:hypothetical protein